MLTCAYKLGGCGEKRSKHAYVHNIWMVPYDKKVFVAGSSEINKHGDSSKACS